MNKNDNIHDCWCNDNERRYDSLVSSTMRHRRFIDLRSLLKMNDNTKQKPRGIRGYDPCTKYRLIWDVMVHNMNQMIKKAELDCCIDETSWAHGGFGSEALTRIMGKPGVNKGGQTTIVVSAKRRYLIAFHHRHRLQPKEEPFTQQGPSEVKALCDLIEPLIKENNKHSDDVRRQIFEEHPCFILDNHFSGDDICHYLGSRKFKAVMTVRRDRLPKPCDKKYFNHLANCKVDAKSRAARFDEPIVAVKYDTSGANPYVRAHVSFQSTGATNITTINAIDQCSLYVRTKERGRGQFKRTYGIEMNDARSLYLGGYCTVDTIDHLLKNWDINYQEYGNGGMHLCITPKLSWR